MNRRTLLKLLGAGSVAPVLPVKPPFVRGVVGPLSQGMSTMVCQYIPDIWAEHYVKMLKKRIDHETLEGLFDPPPVESRTDRVVIGNVPKITFSLPSSG